jgi:hypothetical protein
MTTSKAAKATTPAPFSLATDLTDEFAKGVQNVVWNGDTLNLKHSNDQKGMATGKILGLYFHWPVTDYNDIYNSYHLGVPYFPKHDKAGLTKNLNFSQLGKQLWKRNTGHIGMSLCGMWDASMGPDGKLHAGPFPLKDAQLKVAARAGAEFCILHGIDPRGSHQAPEYAYKGGALVPTGKTIWIPNVTDHAWFGKRDGYGSWDCGPYTPIILQQLFKDYDELKKTPEADRKFLYRELLK